MSKSSLIKGTYENHLHFFYTSRKIIKNRQIDFYPIENLLFNITKSIFDFTNNHEKQIVRKSLRRPTSVFTYKLTGCKNINDVTELFDTIPSIITDYRELLSKDIDIMKLDLDTCIKYISAEALKYLDAKKDPEHFIYWDEKVGKYRTLSPDYLKLQKSIFDVAGIYFLYDHTKSLIYIGKSYHLWKRILSSCLERKASYCSYTVIGNKADTDIYEMYFISKFKPLENGAGKTDDSPTMILPELDFSPLVQVYILSDDKSELMESQGGIL
jgi:hypothetical protein